MTPTDLCVALRRLTPDDIHRVASSIVGESAGDEVDAWRATMAIDRALRHARPEASGRVRRMGRGAGGAAGRRDRRHPASRPGGHLGRARRGRDRAGPGRRRRGDRRGCEAASALAPPPRDGVAATRPGADVSSAPSARVPTARRAQLPLVAIRRGPGRSAPDCIHIGYLPEARDDGSFDLSTGDRRRGFLAPQRRVSRGDPSDASARHDGRGSRVSTLPSCNRAGGRGSGADRPQATAQPSSRARQLEFDGT